jgi:hypothetical protein
VALEWVSACCQQCKISYHAPFNKTLVLCPQRLVDLRFYNIVTEAVFSVSKSRVQMVIR